MKIGIDLLGADDKSKIINFVNDFKDSEVELVAYGLEEDLNKIGSNVKKILCTEEVLISDDAARVHRRKKDSSMIKMLEDLKNNEIDASISAGSTGAYMASGIFILGRIDGVAKPALATMLPTKTDHKFLLTDLGANVETKETDLLNYAKLGELYIKNIYNIEKPTTALINVGAEDNKGSRLYKDAHILLKENMLNFKGNIEARDILEHNYDLVIVDGFTGNVLLKSIEGVALTLSSLLKSVFLKNIFTKLAALIVKSGLKKFKNKFDYSEYGGAILMGLKKPAIKIHGSSDEVSVYYAVQQAKNIHKSKLYDKMIKEFKGE
ncbi:MULTISPECIES: phosphate acyltransferase PlsX [unclassified Gemella]|uniref:phosphate acyltransferase PlsX n=1 Tax=unclassified Gemella TaxID=2624949 RepID=UPI001072F7FD|nr:MULTISPECIES: phosphate acyltransferase PlsX [unclassified Gemella]MBF0710230.1 phosphate acyltransferase PlsX [Gemella sp. GL1.1]MBF0746530.1 phosphate acyltransferase PlsX [Gemella sp. 19428wG2_WT2a]NYS27574.1 phosphate acyltransferase PlsX [Gemella sp. GL1]TFU60308.1 phosphate acyltransferase PlsX [Gemella sp. WT2a]